MATSVALEQALENSFTHYHSLGFFKAFRKGAQNMPKSWNQDEDKNLVCFSKALILFNCSGHCITF